ncbi:hypothetical protein ACSQ67_014833 [Phaseolus vulgaris]
MQLQITRNAVEKKKEKKNLYNEYKTKKCLDQISTALSNKTLSTEINQSESTVEKQITPTLSLEEKEKKDIGWVGSAMTAVDDVDEVEVWNVRELPRVEDISKSACFRTQLC